MKRRFDSKMLDPVHGLLLAPLDIIVIMSNVRIEHPKTAGASNRSRLSQSGGDCACELFDALGKLSAM